jgi:NifB/MoaA-like Fe-S oxidoreductase
MQINVYKIINHFFGESITVAGLLTGKDILEQLSGEDLGEVLYIPQNALRAGEETFLCGMTVGELSEKLGISVVPMSADGYELAVALLEE